MPRQIWYIAAAAIAALALLYVLGVLGGEEAVTPPAPLGAPPVGTPGATG